VGRFIAFAASKPARTHASRNDPAGTRPVSSASAGMNITPARPQLGQTEGGRRRFN